MAKRVAGRELTKDNWDDEEQNEQAGTFKIACETDLSKRKIIKARRRIPSADKEAVSKNASSIFQGFTGFAGFKGLNSDNSAGDSVASKPSQGFVGFTSTLSAPGFSSSMASASATTTTGFTGFAGLAASNHPTMSPPQITGAVTASITPKLNGHSLQKTPNKDLSLDKAGHEEYLESIKALNQSVNSWIQQHVSSNPYIDLTPVFNDYCKHMAEIEGSVSSSKELPASSVYPPLVTSTIAFGISEQKEDNNTTSPSSTVKEESAEEKPFEGLVAKSTQNAASGSRNENEGEQDSEPPKPVSVVHAEEGFHFSVRCKLFFKRDTSWSELGVGMLNMKELGGKTQLLVRADTATGKILLNIFLVTTMPITRSGKNNVMLVAVPNPPLYSKPTEGDNSKPATYLIRVKTAESADELYEKLKSTRSNQSS